MNSLDLKISVLIFDFFGVICSEIAPFWLAKHFSDAEAQYIKESIVGAADRGQLSQTDMFSKLSAITDIPSEIIEEEWQSYVKIDTELVKWIRHLRSKYKIALLTNSPSPFVRKIIDDHNLATLFDDMIISAEYGIAKPDRAIYVALLQSLGVKPGNAVFIDDNPRNIESAQLLGIIGVLFRTLPELKVELSKIDT